MVFEVILISCFLAYIRSGSLGNLESWTLRGKRYIVFALFLKFISLVLITRTDTGLSYFLYKNFSKIHILYYGLFILGLFKNYKRPGMKLSVLGSFFNLLAMIFNEGRMPVYTGAVRVLKNQSQYKLLLEDKILTHVLVDKGGNLLFLSDFIAIPSPYPFEKVISLGDILLGLGLGLYVYKGMLKEREKA